MAGELYQYLADDHDRLDRLLREATENPGAVRMEPYAAFRKGLLRHISMEEKVLLPMIARRNVPGLTGVTQRIRLDHGALVALLVPPPSAPVIATLRSILEVHNALEEKEGGVYRLFEEWSGPEAEKMLEKLKAVPDVPVLPHNGKPEVLEATRRAVARAGYEFREAVR